MLKTWQGEQIVPSVARPIEEGRDHPANVITSGVLYRSFEQDRPSNQQAHQPVIALRRPPSPSDHRWMMAKLRSLVHHSPRPMTVGLRVAAKYAIGVHRASSPPLEPQRGSGDREATITRTPISLSMTIEIPLAVAYEIGVCGEDRLFGIQIDKEAAMQRLLGRR